MQIQIEPGQRLHKFKTKLQYKIMLIIIFPHCSNSIPTSNGNIVLDGEVGSAIIVLYDILNNSSAFSYIVYVTRKIPS